MKWIGLNLIWIFAENRGINGVCKLKYCRGCCCLFQVPTISLTKFVCIRLLACYFFIFSLARMYIILLVFVSYFSISECLYFTCTERLIVFFLLFVCYWFSDWIPRMFSPLFSYAAFDVFLFRRPYRIDMNFMWMGFFYFIFCVCCSLLLRFKFSHSKVYEIKRVTFTCDIVHIISHFFFKLKNFS